MDLSQSEVVLGLHRSSYRKHYFLSVALLVWPLMLQNYLAFQKYLAS
jgi:hypothetical protein